MLPSDFLQTFPSPSWTIPKLRDDTFNHLYVFVARTNTFYHTMHNYGYLKDYSETSFAVHLIQTSHMRIGRIQNLLFYWITIVAPTKHIIQFSAHSFAHTSFF